MNKIEDLEKKINSELTTKIKESKILHNQLYLSINSEDLLDVILLLKTNKDTKFKQLIDITAVDYPENKKRFKIVYLLLSHESNQRILVSYFINENEKISSLVNVLSEYFLSILSADNLIGVKGFFTSCAIFLAISDQAACFSAKIKEVVSSIVTT